MNAPYKKAIAFVPLLFILVAMFSLQGGSSLAKTLIPQIGALGVSTLRLLFGSLLLMVLLRPWKNRKKFILNQRSVLILIIYGLNLGAMNILFYQALTTVPLGITVALEFTGPLLLALFASRRRTDFIWIALAVFGLYFLLPIDQSISDIDPIGAGYALGAGACWALYIISGKQAGKYFGTQAVALGVLLATFMVVPIGIYQVGVSLFSLSILPAAVGVALLAIAIPFTLEMMAMTRLPTKTFSTLMSMEPAVAALCGFVFLQEILTRYQWLALIAIILASMGTTLTIKHKEQQ